MSENKDTELAGAPGAVTIGDKTYLCNQHTRATAFACYERSLKEAKRLYNPFRVLQERTKDLEISAADKSALLLQVQAIPPLDSYVELAGECMRSCEGVAFEFWLLAKPNHPELTLEESRTAITESNRVDVLCQLDSVSGANHVTRTLESAGFFLHP
jgi:hypothetical protein